MMILFGLLLLSGPSASGRSAEVSVRAVIESIRPDDERGDATGHLFCDREARLEISVSAMHQRPIDLRARLVQLGSGLAAPVGEASPVIANEGIGPTSRVFPFRFTLPKVKRVSNVELQFFWRNPGEETWFPAGRAPLRIYPADAVEPLRSIGENKSLLVLDAEGRLRSFLRKENVAFVELSTSMTGSVSPSPEASPSKSGPKNALAIWVPGEPHSRPRDSRRTIERLFRMAGTVMVLGVSNDYPMLKLIRTRNRTRLDVEMPLLPSLADDPRSQLAFVEAVLMAVSPEDPILFDPEGGTP